MIIKNARKPAPGIKNPDHLILKVKIPGQSAGYFYFYETMSIGKAPLAAVILLFCRWRF